MNDKLNITIRIANQPPVPMQIYRKEEEAIRSVEYNINQLWDSWCRKHPKKTPETVLAMVAFRFAQLYYSQSVANNDTEQMLSRFEKNLDEILFKTMGE